MTKFLMLLQAFCLSFVLSPAAHAAEPPPLSAYGALPGVEDMALSLGGTRLAAITTIRGERLLLLMDNELRPLRRMTLGDVKVRSIDWVGEDRVLMRMSQTEDLGFGFTADQAEISPGRGRPLAVAQHDADADARGSGGFRAGIQSGGLRPARR